ncbi:outer membrane protein assembly factor BamA [Tabrizicola oligotrophica]|uniref:Outer membrane protein assembly factor BamA n=1 Tax=Tabrizicola oligotrophica TaxID=2710650 RepID=A0A6M0QMY5_9RHOB|nr:outer membrane protein assembly factor BamA [Tabrizicola oligotrophica]NEY88745.1 outer membrane protein assembly factor BamA [Tabrizicola oligotrophica]
MRISAKAIGARGRVGNRVVRPAAMALLLCGTVVSTPFFTPAFAQDYSFSNVVIEGNDRVDAATILSYAGIGKGQALTTGQLNDAYQRIVNSGLFETVELQPQGGTLKIVVQEMPMLNTVDLQGNKRLKDDRLAGLIKSKSRNVFNPATAEADAAAIADAYRTEGRLAATVTPKLIRRSDNRVDLVFEIVEGKVVEVERLSFVGNRAYSDRRLRQVLETKQAGLLRQIIGRDTFVTDRLELDKQLLKDFYLSRGYIDVEVLDATGEISAERDASFVTVTVQEGQQYRIGEVSTVSTVDGLDANEFIDVQKLRSGTVYSPALIENNIARMETLALKKGLNFIRVEPVVTRNEANQTLDIEFVLSKGERVFVERIDIEGNTTTLDQVIRRQFRTAEGDPFNPREIRQAAERIRALGYFGNADVEAAPGSGGDQVVVNVDVEEKPTGSLSVGASFSVNSGAGLTFGFSEDNFLGRGQKVGIDITTGSDTVDSSLTFVEPSLLGRDLKLKFGAYYKTSDYADAFYDTKQIAISPALEFPVSEFGRLELRYRVFDDKITNVDADSSAVLVAEEAMGSPLGSSIGYSYSYDNKIGGLNPNNRFLLRFSQDLAGLGGDVKYLKTEALALAETKILNEEVTLRAVVEGGAIATSGGYTSRVTDRYFGNGKIRGFEPNGLGPRDLTGVANEDALGGNMFAVARFEADFPLGLPEEYGIKGGAFLDVGSVWGLDNTLGGTIDDSAKLRSSIGLSVLWETPLGPLRFNFSKALKKEAYDKEQRFDLTITTKF